MVGFLFLLGQKGMVEILQNRHILRDGMLKIVLVNLVDAAVNDRFLNGLQALLAADDQLAQGENEVGLQRHRIVLLAVAVVDVHGIDILGAVGRDFDNLTAQPHNQR